MTNNNSKDFEDIIFGGRLNPTDWKIIHILLKEEGNLTMKMLSDEVGVAPVNLWKRLKKLAEDYNFIHIPHAPKGVKKFPKLTEYFKKNWKTNEEQRKKEVATDKLMEELNKIEYQVIKNSNMDSEFFWKEVISIIREHFNQFFKKNKK